MLISLLLMWLKWLSPTGHHFNCGHLSFNRMREGTISRMPIESPHPREGWSVSDPGSPPKIITEAASEPWLSSHNLVAAKMRSEGSLGVWPYDITSQSSLASPSGGLCLQKGRNEVWHLVGSGFYLYLIFVSVGSTSSMIRYHGNWLHKSLLWV